ncbi:MAG: (d)CMP kinase [Oscillospiraceae bacterium]|nr:(d)CMP kinase [Oscillospiraceae bacterium]
MKKTHYSVAVDGPSGAGKSTLAKEAARELQITYVDTGAIYRVIGLAAQRRGIGTDNAAEIIPVLPELDIGMRYADDGTQRMYLNGEDVSEAIRLPEISMQASAVSALAEVRAFLLEMQRSLARRQSVIMDGRDIGTVVLPDADVKIFLTADAEVRARRRFRELEQRGTPRPYDEVLEELKQRDWNDTHRDVAPLRCADDAITVDTSGLSFEESRNLLIRTIRERVGA